MNNWSYFPIVLRSVLSQTSKTFFTIKIKEKHPTTFSVPLKPNDVIQNWKSVPSWSHEPLKTTDGSTVVNRSIRKIQRAAKAFLLFGQELQLPKAGVRHRKLTAYANAFQAKKVMSLKPVHLPSWAYTAWKRFFFFKIKKIIKPWVGRQALGQLLDYKHFYLHFKKQNLSLNRSREDGLWPKPVYNSTAADRCSLNEGNACLCSKGLPNKHSHERESSH